MDRERIRQAALGRRAAQAEVDRTMRRRLVVYLAGIVLLGLWIVFNRGEEAPTRPSTPLAAPGEVPDGEREPLAQVDRELLRRVVSDGDRSQRALLEPEARDHLLLQAGRLVYGDLEKLGLERGDWQALTRGPEAHRGAPFWTLGTLQWVQQETLDRRPVWRGGVLDEQGHAWSFLVLTEPWNVATGDVVKVQGFFFKVWDVLRPDGSWASAPLLVGEEVLRSAFRMAPVVELRPEMLREVRDYDLGQASAPLESPEYYELLSYVVHAPDEEILPAGQTLPEVLPAQLLADPMTWRGQTVQLTGVLLYVREVPLGPRGENPLGEPKVWQLWISDNRAGDAGTVLALSLEAPAVAERDIVDVKGVFFRRLAFETRRQEPRMAAVVMIREVTTFVPPADELTPVIVQGIAWMVVGLVLLLALGQWRERRALAQARLARLARKRKRVQQHVLPETAGQGGESLAEGGAGAPS